MILLDTHIWIWWVHGDERLDVRLANLTASQSAEGRIAALKSCSECSFTGA